MTAEHRRGRREGSPSFRSAPAAFLVLVLVVVPGVALRGAEPPGAAGGAPPPRPVERLEALWPGHPEWVAMLVDILSGSQLGPSDGWFRKAVAQSRYDWKGVAARLDRDGDGRIARGEFSGPDADFARLDRDHDGVISPADLDFSAHALTPSAGMLAFYRADRDGNGKVTREEFEALFRSLDDDRAGFLSLADFQQGFAFPPRRGGRPSAAGRASGPSKATLVRGLIRQEIGSRQPGPAVGDVAPDFDLKSVDGREELRLSKLVGPKPVVLVFGNFTCGPFRAQGGNVEKVYLRNRDRATFVMVYVREAHPIDGWQMESNDRVGVALRQPRDYEERVGVARTCSRSLGLSLPMVVDTIDDRVGARYSGMPSRLYVLDRRGTVVYKSGRGPFGFKPDEMEQALLLLLQDESAPASAPGSEDPSHRDRPGERPRAAEEPRASK